MVLLIVSGVCVTNCTDSKIYTPNLLRSLRSNALDTAPPSLQPSNAANIFESFCVLLSFRT